MNDVKSSKIYKELTNAPRHLGRYKIQGILRNSRAPELYENTDQKNGAPCHSEHSHQRPSHRLRDIRGRRNNCLTTWNTLLLACMVWNCPPSRESRLQSPPLRSSRIRTIRTSMEPINRHISNSPSSNIRGPSFILEYRQDTYCGPRFRRRHCTAI